MKHGGERVGAGRPATPLDERRMMHLVAQGVTQRDIATRFGVGAFVINRRIKKLRKQAAL